MMSQPTNMDMHLPALKAMLNEKFGYPDAFESISKNLRLSGSVLAGGSILQVIAKYKTPTRLDLDFYCPTEHVVTFIESFIERRKATKTKPVRDAIFGGSTMEIQAASFYCSSFLRKNGIRKIYRLSRIDNTSPEAIAVPSRKRAVDFAQMIDFMSVRNSRAITDVVQNFDLTFCQVWYDGRSIWASHPEDIQNKSGTLQKDYSNLFINGNAFLRKRVQKYKTRGFTIKLDPEAPTLNVDRILNKKSCLNPASTEDPEYFKRWAMRLLMKYILGVRTPYSLQDIDALKPLGIDGTDVLLIPAFENPRFKNKQFLHNQNGNILETHGSRYPTKIEFELDDGYDSEDYTELSSLKTLAHSLQENSPNNLGTKPEDLSYYRQANILLRNTLYPYTFAGKGNLGFMLKLSDPAHQPQLLKYKKALEEHCTRKSTCYLMKSDDETVYDLHTHPLEGAISQDGMEGYLTSHIGDSDKQAIPCYYKPQPPTAAEPKPAGNCYKYISLSEVRMIVSDEFWAKYSAPIPLKTGLGETIGAWNTTLTNIKEPDAQFGDIYTKTICPFCLQLAERSSGCAYMGHDNPKGLSADLYPYCQEEFVVKEIVDKYRKAAKHLDPGVQPHLEWCVECGRPSAGHEHLTTTDPIGKEPPPKKPNPDNPAQMIYDYGKCSGGGRAELFARILAIRAIYRDAKITNPKTERISAALAADKAPNDPDLMARGRAIAAQEAATRKWNNAPIPETKVYNVAIANASNNHNFAGGKSKSKRKIKRRTLKVTSSTRR